MKRIMDALRHFPTCKKLPFYSDLIGVKRLSDPDLHALLHHPTTLSCSDLTLDGFTHHKAEKVPVNGDEKQPELSARVTRSKRKYSSVISTRKRKFSWADIRLANVKNLQLC